MAEGRVHLHEVDALIHAAQVFTLTAVSKCDTPAIFFQLDQRCAFPGSFFFIDR